MPDPCRLDPAAVLVQIGLRTPGAPALGLLPQRIPLMPLPDPDRQIDCEGLLCPLPVLRARKTLLSMAPGEVLTVTATDRMAAIDLPHFCTQTGHAFLGQEETGAVTRYWIRRGPLPGQE